MTFAAYAWLSLALGGLACLADVTLDRWRWRRVAEGCRSAALRVRLQWRRD